VENNVGECQLQERVEDHLVEREERRIALLIAECISSNLGTCLGPNNRKLILGRVLDHKKVRVHLPDHILTSKVATAYGEVGSSVSVHQELVKMGNSAAKLATKQTILDATVNSGTGHSLLRQVAKVLGIHHRNLTIAIGRCEVTNSNELFLCMLSIQKKRTDGPSINERKVIIDS